MPAIAPTYPAPAYSVDWASRHFPTWQALFTRLGWAGKPGLRFLEIGCFEGMATRWFLEHVLTDPSSSIHVIDTFEGSPEHANLALPEHGLCAEFLRNIAPYRDQVFVEQGTSHEALTNLLCSRLMDDPGSPPLHDFVYIDGSHRAPDVLTDAVLAWPLLMPGGVMLFDDYGWQYRLPDGELLEPTRGIDAFLSAFAGRYTQLVSGPQVAVQKH